MSSSPSTPPQPTSTRRSSRRTAIAQRQRQSVLFPTKRGLPPITAFQRPWTQHYIDIGHCRLNKCIKRIQEAKENDIEHLSVSFLAMAVKASSAYGPKSKQEQALIVYTRAVMARGIQPNDHDFAERGQGKGGSAVSLAAYYGYKKLLKLLLDAVCPIVNSEPHALFAAVRNGQHDCMRLLLKERPGDCKKLLRMETRASWPIKNPTTFQVAIYHNDVEAVRILREACSDVMPLCLVSSGVKKLESILQQLYPNTKNIFHWSKEMHWSFPGADRRMINWLWHSLRRQQQEWGNRNGRDDKLLLPCEVWVCIFGYIGRSWWPTLCSGAIE